MTFQVQMVGTDGLILASDRRQTYYQPPSTGIAGTTQPQIKFKFCSNADNSVICAFAGSPYAEDLANLIAINCKPKCFSVDSEWKEHVLEVASRGKTVANNADEVTVIRPSIIDSMLTVVRQGVRPISASWTVDRLCTGMDAPSRFLPRHFWRPAPVEELRPIALLAVAFASTESDMIGGGIDLLKVSLNGIEWEYFSAEDEDIKKAMIQFKDSIADSFPAVPAKFRLDNQ